MSQINPSVVTTAFPLPGRNVYDLSHKASTDLGFGIVVPFEHIDLNPFERLEYTPVAVLKSINPALNPILSRARVRIFALWSPYKNYMPSYLTNSIEDDQYMPLWRNFLDSELASGDDSILDQGYNIDVQPLSIANCIGVPIGFNPLRLYNANDGKPADRNRTGRFMNAHRYLTYYDFLRNYIFDRNQSQFPVQVNEYSAKTDLPWTRNWELAQLTDLDNYYENKLWYANSSALPVVAFPPLAETNDGISTYSFADWHDAFWRYFASGGLCLKPHMPDINSAFASNSKYEEAMAKSLVRLTGHLTNDEGIAYSDIIDGSKIYNFYNKVLATGGQLDEMIRAEFGVNVTDDLDIPMFLRQWSFDVDFEDVVSNAEFGNGINQSLGDVASRAIGSLAYEDKKSAKRNTLTFRSKFHGTMCFYAVIEPYVEYKDGLDPFLMKISTLDNYWPSFDRAGWQPLPLSNLVANNVGTNPSSPASAIGAYFESQDPFLNQVGVQPAYTEYKGKVSRVQGEMANTLYGWSFIRNFEFASRISTGVSTPYSTYIFPESYNNAFATTKGVFSNNFVLTVGQRIIIKRPISRVQLSTTML